MATSSDVLCSICEAQHTIKNADNWCPECEEGLCSECLKHHNVSKYTKSHEVISIDNYHKIPQSVSQIVQHCTEHDRRYQHYCPMHESLCCPLCISEHHNDCLGLLAIENIVKTAKSSAMLDSIEDTFKDMSSNMERVIRDKEGNLTKITDQRRKIHSEIQEERRKINEHLDKLEEHVIGNLDAEEAKIKSEIENLLENLNKKAVTIEILQRKLSALKLYASDLQTFLGGRTILREVEEEEMYVTALLEEKCLQQVNVCYRTDGKLAAINNIEIFGSVCRETNPPVINIKIGKDKQAQIMTITPPVKNVSIHDINLVLLRKKERLCNQITGCTITPNGKFICADYGTKGLHILNEDWTSDNLDTKLPAIKYAFDVTCIDDTRLAISNGDHHQINILSIASKKIEKIINTSYWCYGIAQNEGSLLLCEGSRGISKVQVSDNSISPLVKQETFPDGAYVITSGDNIYHTNTTNTISCHKINGDKLWEFQDVAIIREPRGVAVDNDLNVYVASEGNNSVVLISPDGKRCKTVLGKSDGIDRPTAIYFDKVKNNLVVCNANGTAFLYKVE